MACCLFSSMQAFSRSRSISWRARSELAPLSAIPIEIPGLQPSPIGARDAWPILVDDREPGRIAALTLYHHVLTEEPLEAEAEAPRGAPRAEIARIAFPLNAPITQVVEGVAQQ